MVERAIEEKQIALKACPFCGSEDVEVKSGWLNIVLCNECRAQGPTVPTGRAAVRAWNVRKRWRKKIRTSYG